MMFNRERTIVTGGAQGIGRAITDEFAQEGAIPIIFDIDDERGNHAVDDLTEKGYESFFVKCDISDVKNIEQAVQKVVKKYGGIDILINNAGILHSTPIEDITEDEWDKIMAVNLKSVFFMTQKVIPYMKKNHYGKIVNVSSLAGRMGGIANGLGYTASKAGIIGLTYGFATRLAEYNINVNAVAPGTTETNILKSFSEEKIKYLRESILIKRLGTPQDIASATVFLASPKASFITGVVLDINGGLFVG